MPPFQSLSLLGFVVIALHVLWAQGLFEFICTEEGLYTPYIHVYRGRKGAKIHSSGPGFFDLQEHTDLYICVNGPVFYYFSINYTNGEVFDSPEFNVSAHLCATYNKSPKRGHNHPSVVKKLHGILLMGDSMDYRKPAIQLLTAPMWNYNTKRYENGTSIIVFGNEDCVISKKGENITIQPSKAKAADQPEFCMRVFGESTTKPEEEELLRADAAISVIGCTPKPPAVPAAGGTTGAGTSTGSLPEARRKRQAPNSTVPVPGPPPPPSPIEVTACEPLPIMATECEAGKPQKDHACSIFKSMLGTEDPAWPSGAEWRQPVLNLLVDIFAQTCSRVPKAFARKINNIFKFYLTAALTANPGESERDFWKYIVAELEICKKRKRMLFFQPNAAQPGNHMYLKGGTQVTPLSHYVEEAENEFAFNWAVDMEWKVFATVLGICTPTSSPKKASISSRFYTLFIEDFLNPINNTWIEYKDNLLFQFILGEFYHGETESWLNNCMEASFIESNSGSYRPLRPILVNDLLEDNYFLGNKRRKR